MLTTKDLMTINPSTVTPDTPLREVVALMSKMNYRQVLVVEDEMLIGIITDRDIRLAVSSPRTSREPLEHLQILDGFTTKECMTLNPRTITPDTPIHQVARLLAIYKYGALPVVDGEKLIGIITVTDLLNQMALIPEPG